MEAMDSILFTPRLKLTLVTKAERGSPELEWLHDLHSNEKASWWSIRGQAKSIEDTEKTVRGYLSTRSEDEGIYRVAYAVHKVLESGIDSAKGELQQSAEPSTEFIGLVTLRSLNADNLVLPEHLTLPSSAAASTLTVELGYMFLPIGWGKGYATESVKAVLEASKKARSFWAPFSKLYVRAIVNVDNPPSLRVMKKNGITETGIYEFTREAIFLAGEWREEHRLHIFGMHLFE